MLGKPQQDFLLIEALAQTGRQGHGYGRHRVFGIDYGQRSLMPWQSIVASRNSIHNTNTSALPKFAAGDKKNPSPT